MVTVLFLHVKGGLKFAPKKPPKKPAKVVPKTYVIQSMFSFIVLGYLLCMVCLIGRHGRMAWN
jgi:hypothetical protein